MVDSDKSSANDKLSALQAEFHRQLPGAIAEIKQQCARLCQSEMSHDDITAYDAGITRPQAAIAKTGSLVEISKIPGDRRISLIPETHIALVYEKDILPDMNAFFIKYGASKNITFITGPSRTADIEKRIVIGAHGPKRLIIFLLKK